MSLLSERIREALHDQGMSQAELARRAGCTRATVNDWVNDRTASIRGEFLMKAAAALAVSPEWLNTGKGAKHPPGPGFSVSEDSATHTTVGRDASPIPANDDRFVEIPKYQVSAAAGGGSNVYTEEPNGTHAYQRKWIRDEGLNPKDLVSIEVDGESMSPTIRDGDTILVDMSQRTIFDDEVYVFRVDHDLRVKRLRKNLNGTITISSDNKGDPSYVDEVVRFAELEAMDIVGRVVDRSGKVGRRRR